MSYKDTYGYTQEAKESFNEDLEQFSEYDFSKEGLEELNIAEAAKKITELITEKEEVIKKSFTDYLVRYLVNQEGIEKTDCPSYILEKQKQNKDKNGNTQLLTKQRINACFDSQDSFIPKRDYIFKLGFILGMQPEAVEELLHKGIGDRGFNFKNPLEVIYWYCLKQNYGFLKVREYVDMYNNIQAEEADEDRYTRDIYNNVRPQLTVNLSDETLMTILSEIKSFAISTYNLNNNEDIDFYNHRLHEEFKLTFQDTQKELQKELDNNIVHDTDIENGPSGICSYLYGQSIVRVPNEKIKLPKSIVNDRLTKQLLGDILRGEKHPSRHDLITIFFLYNQFDEAAVNMNNNERVEDFLDVINLKLEICGMQPMNINNPYEYFILLCMSTEEPLMVFQEIFADAIEL